MDCKGAIPSTIIFIFLLYVRNELKNEFIVLQWDTWEVLPVALSRTGRGTPARGHPVVSCSCNLVMVLSDLSKK